ncbi:MAG: hypothetical protein IPP71_06110 [Bacteroidetes bacterium]|nr:hypothetical protein [Bacteroidota bacterium]
MAIYRFRVSFEEFDDTYRDIEIKSVQSFEHFHLAIQEAIGFDATKPASFFMSNDLWKKGQEITLVKTGENHSQEKLLMKDAILCDFIADPHQKIYYVFDAPSQWSFFIELFKILPDSAPGKKYPVCVKIHGDAPKQYVSVEIPKGAIDPEFIDEEMFQELLEEEVETDSDNIDSTGEVSTEFTEEVDEEEFDNIEETSDDEAEKE